VKRVTPVVQKMMGYSKSKSVTVVTAYRSQRGTLLARRWLWKHRPVAAEAGRSYPSEGAPDRAIKDAAICALMRRRPNDRRAYMRNYMRCRRAAKLTSPISG
jgi:hypothetical protein